MSESSKWAQWINELAQMDEELPGPSEERIQQWISMGPHLPDLLSESEFQMEDRVEAALLARLCGDPWMSDLSDLEMWLVKLRLEWAIDLMMALQACELPPPSQPEFLIELVSQGWEHGGFGHIHDNSLCKILCDALRGIEPSSQVAG